MKAVTSCGQGIGVDPYIFIALVQRHFQQNTTGSSLLVFCNRDRDKLKTLEWDPNEFWLHDRRLEGMVCLAGGRRPWSVSSNGS